MIKPPEWWHSTRIIQAFDTVLQDKASSLICLSTIILLNTVETVQETFASEAHQFVWYRSPSSSPHSRGTTYSNVNPQTRYGLCGCP